MSAALPSSICTPVKLRPCAPTAVVDPPLTVIRSSPSHVPAALSSATSNSRQFVELRCTRMPVGVGDDAAARAGAANEPAAAALSRLSVSQALTAIVTVTRYDSVCGSMVTAAQPDDTTAVTVSVPAGGLPRSSSRA